MNSIETQTEGGAFVPRLTDLSSQQVRALDAETHKLWRQQNREDEQSFDFFLSFVDSISPDCRAYYNRIRSENDGAPHAKPADVPVYRVFDALLELIDAAQKDPSIAERLRQQLPQLKANAKDHARKQKADRKAAKATARAQKLAARHRERSKDL